MTQTETIDEVTLSGKKSRILLVDDHSLIRESLVELIHQNTPHEVVGSTGDGRDAISKVASLLPDIVLMDFSLGDGIEGLELIKAVRAAHPRVRILILSARAHIERVEEAARCGADGFLAKSEPPKRLYAALDQLSKGLPISQSSNSRSFGDLGRLSDREREILRLLGIGYAVREIAVRLGISRKTVETHRCNIRYKLQAESSDDLRRFARDYYGNHEGEGRILETPALGGKSGGNE